VCLNIILLPWIWDKLFLKKYRCGYNYLPALGDMRIAVNYFAFEAFRSKVSLNGEVFFFFFSVKKASYKRTVNRKHPCKNECIWLKSVCLQATFTRQGLGC